MASVSQADYAALQAALARGDAQAAVDAQALLQRHSDRLSEQLIRGLMFLGEGRPTNAYTLFLEATSLAPQDVRGFLGVAQALLQLGHGDKAIAAALHARTLDPRSAMAEMVIGDSLAGMGHWAEAITHYRAVPQDDPQALFAQLGLGNALLKLRRLAEARTAFEEAVRLAPDKATGYCNLGYTLMLMGDHAAAIALFQRGLPLTSDVPHLLHANLADAHAALGELDAAETHARRAIALKPDLACAHGTLAQLLQRTGRDGEAIAHFRLHGTPESDAKAVEALYRLGDMTAFAVARDQLAATQPDNRRLAAISAEAAARHGPRYASAFCADPLAQIGVADLTERLPPFGAFIADVLREAEALDAVWEPPGRTTRGGYQTEGDIFALGTPAITMLKTAIGAGIEAYFAARAASRDRYVTHRPQGLNLTGWVVRLRKSGRQDMHIHPDGWLSGVLYARLPPLPGQEGAIGFSLTGRQSAPDILHQPKTGALVLFPSSLYHGTVPFSADAERISIAFDLLPDAPRG